MDRLWWVAATVVYMVVKCFTIGLGQGNGKAQVIVLLVVETIFLGVVSWAKPWIDQRGNIIAITIAAMNFINSILLLIFSGLTRAPPQVVGVCGVIL